MQGTIGKPTSDQVQVELARILDSSDFDASERNRRFLRFVVDETLAGRAERIKGYCIATSVFGRATNFDAQADPIVRIEARRLRRALERYYLMAGKDSPLRITIPKGSYAPTFEFTGEVADTADEAPPATAAAQPRPAAHPNPSIFVAAFEAEGDAAVFPNFASGFTRALIVALTRFTSLVVFGPDTSFHFGPQTDRRRVLAELGADLVLTGGAAVTADRFCIEALLIDARTGRNLWAESFERPLEPTDIIAVRDEVANRVARTLAQPYGVIYRHRAAEAEGRPPEAMKSYDSVIRFYEYWRGFDRDQHQQTRETLERTILREPRYAEAYACLSQVYSNDFRFGTLSRVFAPDSLERSLDLAGRAIELAPYSSRGYHALGLAEWFAGRVDDALEAFETGRRLNPNDTDIMADLGMRRTVLAQWDEGVPLIRESYLRNPAQSGTYRVGLMLFHFMHDRFHEALAEARRLNAPKVLQAQMAVAVAAAKLGLADEARHAVEQILSIDPSYGDHAIDDLKRRNLHPDILGAVIDGLRLAGLAVPVNAHL